MKRVFRNVALFRSRITTNQILVGSNAPIDATAIARLASKRNAPVVPVTGPALDQLIGGARFLEDDFAPVDQLLN